MASWQQGSGAYSKRTRTKDRTAGVSKAFGGATMRTRVAASSNVATAQAITGQATTNAIRWDAVESRDHSAATHWGTALIVRKIITRLTAGARIWPNIPKWRVRAEKQGYQDGCASVRSEHGNCNRVEESHGWPYGPAGSWWRGRWRGDGGRERRRWRSEGAKTYHDGRNWGCDQVRDWDRNWDTRRSPAEQWVVWSSPTVQGYTSGLLRCLTQQLNARRTWCAWKGQKVKEKILGSALRHTK